MANGSQFATRTYSEGTLLELPDGTPAACTNTKQFVGWTATNNYTSDATAPTYVAAGTEVLANATYYAVYALAGTGSANVSTVKMTSFTNTAANMDEYISYSAEQGTAGNAPGVYNNIIRIYQNGGILNVNAKDGATITSITIGSSMATSVTSQIDGGTTSAQQAISAGGKYTLTDLEAQSVKYTCEGTDKNSRLYLNYLEVTYTAGTTTSYTYYSTDCSGEVDTRTNPTIAFAEATKVLTIDDTYTNELTCNSTGAKTYTSSDASVATINANGQVTALKAGTTTITVAVASDATYHAGTASYNLTVVRKTATPTFATASKEIKVAEKYTQTVTPNNHDGSISYSSSNSSIATVDAATGLVIGLAEGTATITASLAQSTKYEPASASYTIQVVAGAINDGQLHVTWMANGEVLTDAQATRAYSEGDALQLPSTEVGDCNGKVFVGWTAIRDYSNPFCPPADLFDSAKGKTVTQNIIYYAVYKK